MKKVFDIFREKKTMSEKDGESRERKLLSNDFIERMIRVEQRVSMSLGETKPYNKTNYYKSLTPSEKKSFDKYLELKGSVRKGFIAVFFLVFFSFLLTNIKVTGNVVGNVVGKSEFNMFTIFIGGIFIAILFIFGIFFFSSKIKDHRFKKHFKALDSVCLSKFTGRTFDN